MWPETFPSIDKRHVLVKGITFGSWGIFVAIHEGACEQHTPEDIMTTKPERLVLITIITWHFLFDNVNFGIRLVLWASHIATSCGVLYKLTIIIVASKYPLPIDDVSRGAMLQIFYIDVFKCVKIIHNKIYFQWICEINWQISCVYIMLLYTNVCWNLS